MTLGILSFLSASLQYFLNGLYGLLQGFFSSILNAIGFSISKVLMDWAYQISAYGMWSIAVMVLGFGIVAAGLYALLAGASLYDDLTLGL